MNLSSAQVRKRIAEEFDKDKGLFERKVAKKYTFLRDDAYWLPKRPDVYVKVVLARRIMAETLGIGLQELALFHTGKNGRFDCDNYAIFGCQIVKALHAAACRDSNEDAAEYAMWPLTRNDMDHTQALCLTQDNTLIIEWITGAIQRAAFVQPDIYMIG